VRPVLLNASPGIPYGGPSGASAHLRGVAEALRPVAVVTARCADRTGDIPVVETGVPGWPSWLGGWREYTEVLAARRVASAAADLSPDLVWERHSLFSDAGWRVSASTGARWILEVNAPLVLERERYQRVRRPAWARDWERDVLLAAPEIVAVSRWLVGWLGELGCRNVRHLPNGVAPHVGRREEARARLGLEDSFVVGFVGSMKPWHGVERLGAVLDRLPRARGLLVGEGPVAFHHPRCVATGRVPEPEVADLCAAMDVGLAPYRADAPPWFCPLKVLALRAQGTPVVTTEVGDCRELVGLGGTVLPAAAGDDDLAAAAASWEGRRCVPWVRTWAEVVGEGVAGASPETPKARPGDDSGQAST
jgi:glycosyltransferase involved in cell wall biosynthesis